MADDLKMYNYKDFDTVGSGLKRNLWYISNAASINPWLAPSSGIKAKPAE